MSDPTISDIDFKNKMALVWTNLNKKPLKLESQLCYPAKT